MRVAAKFHDRTGLIPATQLKLFVPKVAKQEREILAAFTSHPEKEFTARTMRKYLKGIGVRILLSSVRRSCTHLKQAGFIRATKFKKGACDRPVYFYKLNKRK